MSLKLLYCDGDALHLGLGKYGTLGTMSLYLSSCVVTGSADIVTLIYPKTASWLHDLWDFPSRTRPKRASSSDCKSFENNLLLDPRSALSAMHVRTVYRNNLVSRFVKLTHIVAVCLKSLGSS